MSSLDIENSKGGIKKYLLCNLVDFSIKVWPHWPTQALMDKIH